jgi:lysozyme
MMSQNMIAFLTMIAHSEGVDHVTDSRGNAVDPYRVCYGKQHVIADFSYHPAQLRPDGSKEWAGERITQGIYAGDLSTAAGRYQITRTTWVPLQERLRLPDFSPASQDAAAMELLRECGASPLIDGGQVANAITLSHHIWASLPGNTAGQPITPFADLMRSYTEAGGAFA